MEMKIPALNLFMMCKAPQLSAQRPLPEGFHFRTCKKEELEVWKLLSIGNPQALDFMTRYFNQVYAARQEEFFRRCLFVCDAGDRPVGTCFLWRAYDRILTLHWFRVLPEFEGRGIGRALLSEVLRPLSQADYPVFIHTHPSSFRAIKLYSDFGFHLLHSPQKIGNRQNDYERSLPYLKACMPGRVYDALPCAWPAPERLIEAANSSEIDQF